VGEERVVEEEEEEEAAAEEEGASFSDIISTSPYYVVTLLLKPLFCPLSPTCSKPAPNEMGRYTDTHYKAWRPKRAH